MSCCSPFTFGLINDCISETYITSIWLHGTKLVWLLKIMSHSRVNLTHDGNDHRRKNISASEPTEVGHSHLLICMGFLTDKLIINCTCHSDAG